MPLPLLYERQKSTEASKEQAGPQPRGPAGERRCRQAMDGNKRADGQAGRKASEEQLAWQEILSSGVNTHSAADVVVVDVVVVVVIIHILMGLSRGEKALPLPRSVLFAENPANLTNRSRRQAAQRRR